MTPEQLQIIQHSLGVDQYGQGTMYRNHFMTSDEGRDGAICESLCAYGLMRRDNRVPSDIFGGDTCYRVAEAGKRLFFANCPKPPKKTRGQLRYEEWLRLDDCTGETFGEWLKNRKKRQCESRFTSH